MEATTSACGLTLTQFEDNWHLLVYACEFFMVSLTFINKLLNLMPDHIMLLIPPTIEERHLNIYEPLFWIFLKLIDDAVQDVLDTSKLDVISS
jgi:hypothetical protein